MSVKAGLSAGREKKRSAFGDILVREYAEASCSDVADDDANDDDFIFQSGVQASLASCDQRSPKATMVRRWVWTVS